MATIILLHVVRYLLTMVKQCRQISYPISFRVLKRGFTTNKKHKNYPTNKIFKTAAAVFCRCCTLGAMLENVVSLTTSKYVEMMGLIGVGNNPMVGMTVACAVAVQEAMSK